MRTQAELDALVGTYPPDSHVVESLMNGDHRAMRTKATGRDAYATAYRAYPQESAAPLLRIASHNERRILAAEDAA